MHEDPMTRHLIPMIMIFSEDIQLERGEVESPTTVGVNSQQSIRP